MMLTDTPSVFTSKVVLFKPSKNLSALCNTNFVLYTAAGVMPSFNQLLGYLQQQGLFTDKKALDYSMETFLQQNFNEQASKMLKQTPFELLATPLSSPTSSPGDLLNSQDSYPSELSSLFACLHRYIALITDILGNELAQKPYEKQQDQENVTEEEHAKQAGKISFLLNMPLDDILALLLHDIARPSVNNAVHGHSNHCQEGGVILAPLGLSINYASYHAFAKHLLYHFCEPYRRLLISDASRYTLTIQSANLYTSLHELNELSSEQLAFTLYKLLFMRLVDDMSKVPTSELRKQLQGQEPDYFTSQLIQTMLEKQMITHLNQLARTNHTKEDMMIELQKQLDAAILLLLRAKDYSAHPELYEPSHSVFAP